VPNKDPATKLLITRRFPNFALRNSRLQIVFQISSTKVAFPKLAWHPSNCRTAMRAFFVLLVSCSASVRNLASGLLARSTLNSVGSNSLRRSLVKQAQIKRRRQAGSVVATAHCVLLPGTSLTVAIGGCLAGGLHAISGPDHLAAVLPPCVGQRWWNSSRIGFLWAFGHGLTASLWGIAAFLLKGRLTQGARAAQIARIMTSWAEVIVGLSLILIGYLGVNETRHWTPQDGCMNPIGVNDDQINSANVASIPSQRRGNRAVVANGMLHGCSADGTLTLLPALALPSIGAALLFLVCFSMGTMIAMSAVTTIIGEFSIRVTSVVGDEDFLKKMSFASSGFAVVIGIMWTLRAIYGK
jgi:hypothetical protein